MNLKSILLPLLLITSVFAFSQSPSVGVAVTPTAVCPGDTLTVAVVVSDTFASDNTFIIELSDSTGNFADADTLSVDSSQGNDTLIIPAPVVPASTNYLIRVIGTDPYVIGVPTLTNINFKPLLGAPNDTLTLSGPASFCLGDSLILSFAKDSGVVLSWSFNGRPLPDSVVRYSYKDKDSTGTFIIGLVDTLAAGCSSGFDTVVVAVNKYPAKPGISASGPTGICGSGSVTLSTSDTAHINYQWTDNGVNVPGATSKSITVDSTGLFQIIATSNGCSTPSPASIRVTVHSNPVVSFALPFDSFCQYNPPVTLSGGLPSGGVYSGNYVNGGVFEQGLSGAGTFTVYYTYIDSIGCNATDSSQITIYSDCTYNSITELSDNISFKMFPNPASGNVLITTAQSGNLLLKVYDVTGRQLSEQQFNGQLNMPVANIPAGIYLVEISDLTATRKTVNKLVVE